MDAIFKAILAALRTSEFWAVVGQAIVEALNSPVPDELKTFTWAYIVFRVVSRLVKFIFPNPANPTGGFLKND